MKQRPVFRNRGSSRMWKMPPAASKPCRFRSWMIFSFPFLYHHFFEFFFQRNLKIWQDGGWQMFFFKKSGCSCLTFFLLLSFKAHAKPKPPSFPRPRKSFSKRGTGSRMWDVGRFEQHWKVLQILREGGVNFTKIQWVTLSPHKFWKEKGKVVKI